MSLESVARLRTQLLNYAHAQELRPGEKMGSERELADRLGTSRSALRLALAQLERDGAIRRSMGRGGGILFDDGRIERNLNTIQGVPVMLRQQGFEVATRVLRQDIAVATPAEKRNLELPGSTNVLRVVRLRLANGTPWSLDTSVLPAELFSGLLTHDLTQSLYDVMERHFAQVPVESDETIDTVAANAEQAELLQVELGAPLMQIWRVTRGEGNVPIEFAHDYFRADRTRVHLRRYRSSWKRPPGARTTPGE